MSNQEQVDSGSISLNPVRGTDCEALSLTGPYQIVFYKSRLVAISLGGKHYRISDHHSPDARTVERQLNSIPVYKECKRVSSDELIDLSYIAFAKAGRTFLNLKRRG